MSKLKFKWMCFPTEHRGAFATQGEDEMLEMNTLLMSLVFDTDAKSHQAEASKPPLLVPLVLQLLQG